MRKFAVSSMGAVAMAAMTCCFVACGGSDDGDPPLVDGDGGGRADTSAPPGDSGGGPRDGGGGGGDADAAPAATYKVSVSVVGLEGTGLVLQEKVSGAEVAVAAAAGGATQTATFTAKLPAGASYDVAVKTQPSGPTQTCEVTGGAGRVVAGDVTSITVNCTTAYTVGGTVTGLDGQNLVLENNGAADSVTVNANGQFAFPKALTTGAAFDVKVRTNPTNKWQTCTVARGDGGATAGTIGTANVTDLAVSCSTNQYDVAVAVTGLTGSGLVFRNNGADDLPAAANGTYTFTTKVASGGDYAVTASAQPTSPWQTCTVTAPAGKVAGANVTLNATCAVNTYTVGGTITGLQGNGLVLQNNLGDDVTKSGAGGNGAFSFATKIASGAAYAVTVKTQPTGVAGETCAVSSGAGTVAGADLTSVAVTCSTRTKVLLCGGSGRAITAFIPAGSDLTVSNGCAPDAQTQAILLSRGASIPAATLKSFVEAGGVALTEFNNSHVHFNAVFGTNVAQGTRRGDCYDALPSAVQFTPADPVWQANTFVATPAGQQGCGYEVTAFPGVTPIAGWAAGQVAVAYRNAGSGRLWVTDFDWQDSDTPAANYGYTNRLMGYFITHAR